MADKTLAELTAATAATGGLFYGTQGDADRKFTLTAAGAAMMEAADADAQAALMTALLAKAGGTMTGALVNSTNGASGVPSLKMTGSVFTGGDGTTTKPLVLIEPAGTTSTGWPTAGSLLGANAPSGHTGHLLTLQKNAANVFSVEAGNKVNFFSTAGHYARLDNAAGVPSLVAGYGGGDRCGVTFNAGSGASVYLGTTSSAYPILWGSGSSVNTGSTNQSLLGWGHTNTQLTFTFGASDKSYSGGFTGAGHVVKLLGGVGSSVTTGGAGGAVYVTGGAAAGSGNNNGGDVIISGGAKTASGTDGLVKISSLPTSNPGPGILWNNAGSPAIGT